MEDINVTGIVLSQMPYRDKDKLIHLFSIELGAITCILRSVSSQKSKLKFAGQPFCFGKFELTKSGEFYLVKGVDLIDSFFEITSDYDRYKYCNLMLEVCKVILKPNILAEGLFLILLKTLQNIVYNEINLENSVIKFLLSVLELIGYRLNFEVCDNCNMKFMGDIKFNIESSTFRCANCSGGVVISKQDFMSLKIVQNCDIDKLKTIKLAKNSQKSILSLLILDLSNILNYKFKSVDINEL